METPDDKELFLRILRNDHEAFNTLCVKYWDMVVSIARYSVGSDAEDVAQEVFYLLLIDIKNPPQSDKEFRAYLIMLTRRRSINYYHRHLKRLRQMMQVDKCDMPMFTERVSEDMINGKRHQAILASVMKLKRKHQELFWLHFRNGLTYEQIGLISKQSPKAVKVMFSRFYQRIRSELAKLDDEDLRHSKSG